ncbi:MAG: hypothetical protein ABI415_03420 [Flavitalea sp.]
MVPELRKAFNQHFNEADYKAMMEEMNKKYPGAIEFKVAETPIFIDKKFKDQMINACESIIDLIIDPAFIPLTDNSIPTADKVPGAATFPQTLVFDFGICSNENGTLEPQLIEMQGFPSLYGFQVYYPDVLQKYFDIPESYTLYLGGHNTESFTNLLKEILLNGHLPEEVILLEIHPHQQKTRIDFYCTKDITGIYPVSLTELIQEGKNIFYLRDGNKIKIKRVYNRIIFDELHARDDLSDAVDITKELNVEWAPHPDWFYRISKYTLPFIKHPFVPETFFLNEITQLPANLENYVLKPLFSFAGQGVIIDVTLSDIHNIKDPGNWILQRKVKYAEVIETLTDAAKAEIRIMYLWKEGATRPEPVINLARISKGKMIGVRYNKDKDWVGGSVAYFEK